MRTGADRTFVEGQLVLLQYAKQRIQAPYGAMKVLNGEPMTGGTCMRCFGCRWVCEAHPHMAWEGDYACGAPGIPCPVCNDSDGVEPLSPLWTKPTACLELLASGKAKSALQVALRGWIKC